MCLLLCLSCGRSAKDSGKEQTVKTDTVVPVRARESLQYPGKVKAAQDANLSFRVSGTLSKLYVKEGARVREGQLLAELDSTDYRVQLDAAEAEYRQVKAEAERVMALYKENGTTPNANDKAVYGLKQITAKYKHAQDELAYTRLYAPYDGYVQKRLFLEHETVGAGMPVISFIGAGAPEVEINLPAAEYIRRDRFTGYYCTLELYPGKMFPLKPVSITPKANVNQLYTMRLQMTDVEGGMPSPGMNTTVNISCDQEGEHTYAVPTGAILEKEGKSYVFVYQPADRTVHAREVFPLRLLSDGGTVVASEGLQPGDRIVTAGVHYIVDGERVKLLEPVAETNVGGLM